MNSWPDPISKNQLADLLGKDRRTIDKKLKGMKFEKVGRSHCYDLRTAIESVFTMDGFELGEGDDEDYISPQREKALLDRRRREDLELNIDIKKGKIVPAESVKVALEGVFSGIRSKLLNIPTKVAQTLGNKKKKPKEIEKEVKTLVYECLKELAESEVNETIREDSIERTKSL